MDNVATSMQGASQASRGGKSINIHDAMHNDAPEEPSAVDELDVVPRFTKEDFIRERAFNYLLGIESPYKRAMCEQIVAENARAVGFKNFSKMFRDYQKYMKPQRQHDVVELSNNLSDVLGQPDALPTGEWHSTNDGVWKYAPGNTGNAIVACSHAILPVAKTRSIDTGTIKYTLMWFRGERDTPKFTEIDGADMLSSTDIVKKLSPYGISVSSGDRAKNLVDYLRDVTDLAYDKLAEIKSVSRLGWTADGEGFAPYVDGLAFDGASNFGATYAAITQVGDYSTWIAEAKEAREYSTPARIILAASFAAPLIEPLGTLPFFVHIWSTASSTGKTVGQMLGASVWGNPAPGGAFFPTFKSTAVGIEVIAGFLHSIPLFIDELQLAKDTYGNVRFNVYELASGRGKTRSNKQLGLSTTPTWANCFITSGETPITKETDGEGAINRVFEIEVGSGEKVIADGYKTANNLRQNFGWAGRDFIEHLQQPGQIDRARELYTEFYRQCVESDTTEKQAMAAAVLLTADALATEYIFNDGHALAVSEIAEFLQSRERVSLMERGYNIICDWVSVNANKLRGQPDEGTGDIYGLLDADKGVVYINRTVFNEVCQKHGLNETGLLSHLRSRGLIETKGRAFTKSKRLGHGASSFVTECVWLTLPKYSPEDEQDDELPF